jgi:hypothetical protein
VSTAQKWLGGLTALGALYIVVVNPRGFASGAAALQKLTAGSIVSISTGGKK